MAEKLIDHAPDQLDPEQEYQGFVCDSDEKAEWCIRKIRESEEDTNKWKEHYTLQMEKVEARNNATIQYMNGQLQRYLAHMVASGLARKTKTTEKYVLPSGTLENKHGTYKYQRDDKKLVEWLKNAAMPELIKTEIVQSPMWAELKKLITVEQNGDVVIAETGEIVRGVEAHMEEDSFAVK